MNRLTNKNINWYDDFVFSLRNRLITTDEINNSIYHSLKALEDIEEDIGWSLINVIRVIKYKYIMIKYEFEPNKITIEERRIMGLDYDGNDFILWYHDICDDSTDYVFIKDYGKTWALTKKELEDDK